MRNNKVIKSISTGLAIMLAVGSMSSIDAHAKDYYAEDGTVHVEVENGATLSWQSADNKYNHTENDDNKVNVTTKPESTYVAETTIVSVGDNVSGIEVKIENVQADGSNTTSEGNAIEVGKNSDVEITLDNVTVTEWVDGAAVRVQSGSDVIIKGAGENNTDDTASLTVNHAGNGIYVERDASVTLDGGNDAGDGNLDVVITGNEDANTNDTGSPVIAYGDFTVTNGADLTISDARPNSKYDFEKGYGINSQGNIEISGEGTDVNISKTSMAGIYQEEVGGKEISLTVTNGANVTIDKAVNSGINVVDADLEISKNARVTITNTGLDKETSYGITVGGNKASSAVVKGAQLTIDTTGNNLALDSAKGGINISTDKTVDIIDGAIVKISNSTLGLRVYDNSTVTVRNATFNAKDIASLFMGKDGRNATLKVEENAKVVAGSLRRRTDKTGNIVVIGGTLELTQGEDVAGLNSSHSQILPPKAEEGLVIWPTNGAALGNNMLANFKLTKSDLVKSFETYGLIGDELKEYTYGVDLDKYADDELISVWAPAVILDYFYGSGIITAEELAKLSAAEAAAILGNYGIAGQDAIIRGQSINFGTLNNSLTSGNVLEGIKWYIANEDGSLSEFDADTKVKTAISADIYGSDAETPVTPPGPDPTPTPDPEPTPDPTPTPTPTPVVPTTPGITPVVTPVEPATPVAANVLGARRGNNSSVLGATRSEGAVLGARRGAATGDESKIGRYFAMLAASAFAGTGYVAMRRRKKEEE